LDPLAEIQKVRRASEPASNQPGLDVTKAFERPDIARPRGALGGAGRVPSGFQEESTQVVGGCTIVEFVPIAADKIHLPRWKSRLRAKLNKMRFVIAF
jgi:hypothetical protein